MQTDHIIFKRLELSDADVVYQLTSNKEVSRYMRFDTHIEVGQASALIEDYTAEHNDSYLLYCKETMEAIGVLAIKAEDREPNTYGLSAFSEPKFWNKGYFTEIVTEVIIFAHDILKAKVLKAYVVEANTGSCRVLEKNGFSIADSIKCDDLDSKLLVYTYVF